MPLNKDVGNWIKDFMKSNAPQFKGKSKEERKDMALAAYRAKYGSMNEALMLDKYEVDFFHTKANVYANIEIPSENPTFEDDIQIKGTGKTEEEAFEDLKRNYENYKKTGLSEAKSIPDYKVGDIISFKDGEDWKVMKVKDNVDKLVIKPHNEKAKKGNVSLEIDIDADYLKKNLKEALQKSIIKKTKGEIKENNGINYSKLINLIKSADNPKNQPIYYNSDHGVINVGGVGYDKGSLIKIFNSEPGQSLDIKTLFYKANQSPEETKNAIESMDPSIKVEIGYGYGDEPFVKYIKSMNESELTEANVTWSTLHRDNANEKLLKQSKLSSAEYQKAKKLQGFKASDWKWNADEDLYTKVNEGKLLEDWGGSDQYAMNQSIHRDLGEPKNFPGLSQIMSAAEDAVDFYWDDWDEYETDREGLIMNAARMYANKMFPDFMAGMKKMMEPLDEKYKKTGINEVYGDATNNELASYIGVLQNQIGAEKDPKKLAMLKQDLEDVKNELKNRKLKEDATAGEENEFHKKLDKLVHKTFGHSSDEKKMKEEAKPDFLDVDKDGDKKETMKKAAKDKAVKKAMKKVSEIVKVKTPEEAAKVTKANPDAEVEVIPEVLTEGHGYDYEGKMAHSQLLSIAKNARDLFQMIDSDTQLKSWVQSKLTKAEDYLDSVRTYLEGESLTSTAPAMFENETIKDETGTALSIGDVVKGGDGRIYQVIYSYSEGKPMMVPFDLKRRKPLSLRDKVYFDSDSSIHRKLNKVMDYTATKGGFMK